MKQILLVISVLASIFLYGCGEETAGITEANQGNNSAVYSMFPDNYKDYITDLGGASLTVEAENNIKSLIEHIFNEYYANINCTIPADNNTISQISQNISQLSPGLSVYNTFNTSESSFNGAGLIDINNKDTQIKLNNIANLMANCSTAPFSNIYIDEYAKLVVNIVNSNQNGSEVANMRAVELYKAMLAKGAVEPADKSLLNNQLATVIATAVTDSGKTYADFNTDNAGVFKTNVIDVLLASDKTLIADYNKKLSHLLFPDEYKKHLTNLQNQQISDNARTNMITAIDKLHSMFLSSCTIPANDTNTIYLVAGQISQINERIRDYTEWDLEPSSWSMMSIIKFDLLTAMDKVNNIKVILKCNE